MEQKQHIKAVLRECVRSKEGGDRAIKHIKSLLPEEGKGKDEAIKRALKIAVGNMPANTKDLNVFLDGMASDIISAKTKVFGRAESKDSEESDKK